MDLLKSNFEFAFKKKELASSLRVKSKNYPQFRTDLKALHNKGLITKVHGGRFIYTAPESHIVGPLSITKSGKGFVDSEEKSAHVGSGHFFGALHGDIVKVKIVYEYENRINGEIIEILSRKNLIIQGFVLKNINRFILETPLKLANRNFVLHNLDNKQPEDYTWVEAKVLNWAKPPQEIPVEITKIIGDSQNPKMDLQIISSKYALNLNFPETVINELNKLKTEGNSSNNLRIDLTQLNTITIDPASAKDHDDAISIQKINNNYEIGIHIADVSEFVRQGSLLDKEALRRGTSVYFPDHCIPMLPEEISNGICSLKESEDRFALSLLVEINSKYEVINYKIIESLINVNKKYSYLEIFNIEKEDIFYNDIKLFEKITDSLRKKRIKEGSLNFEIPESEIIINKDGTPKSIKQKKIVKSHHLVEELMLLANRIIAKEFGFFFKGFPFRNHDTPKEIDISDIRQTLIQSSLPKNIKQKLMNKNITLHSMLKLISGLKVERLFSQLALRAMPKANYSPKNNGHFGLGFEYYCHFTSPIRRYPDLIVHRFLKSKIRGNNLKLDDANFIAKECSKSEVIAMNAERDYVKRKQLRFLNNYIGDTFNGIISGLNTRGLFVQLDGILVDGFVSLKSLTDDYYIFNSSKFLFRGRRYKNEYHIGDQVEIKVLNVNIQRAFADFKIII